MAEREMDVEMVGGPKDWRGRRVPMPVDVDRPREEIGAYLISADTPPRDEETEDTDPRAIYTPDVAPAPVTRWIFRGWFPSSPHDPSPDWYR